ncbi:hypothetical protein BV25DRAFT_1991611 [Artomyces pyxidatus]|uniref:Uncharacterized protein n=1 Tax=Artomyces pyxidatus TaxID=48021 RepID=A0ACB8T1D6_9AGAM|nr:hypothetical protein BV25DRAFT_1991611 [Artomyces pyxidatus]
MSEFADGTLRNIFGAAGRDTCEACFKNVGRANLKRCSGCNQAFYCSPQCQKRVWHMHKIICKRTTDALAALPNELLEAYKRDSKAITLWLSHWQPMLYLISPYILGIRDSRGPEMARTHCIVLDITERSNPPTRAQAYRMTAGRVYPIEEWLKEMPDLEFSQEDIDLFADPYAPDGSPLIRIAVRTSSKFCRLMKLGFVQDSDGLDAFETFKDPDEWAPTLAEFIEYGTAASF